MLGAAAEPGFIRTSRPIGHVRRTKKNSAFDAIGFVVIVIKYSLGDAAADGDAVTPSFKRGVDKRPCI